MIRNTDELLKKHFNKNLSDENLNIIDPATGTGTFIYYLLEYFFEQKKSKPHQEKIKKKYKEEIYANEVSILPYYIASLCIEKVYHQYTDDYHIFEGIVYQDTLDNLFYKGNKYTNIQKSDALFKSISNNKNREYPIIDQKIKDTYVKESSAQKTKVYDMYARFIRWASDRIQDSGIVAFVTNNSFINSKTYDGFRKVVGEEFDHIYVVDCKGDFESRQGRPQASYFWRPI